MSTDQNIVRRSIAASLLEDDGIVIIGLADVVSAQPDGAWVEVVFHAGEHTYTTQFTIGEWREEAKRLEVDP